MTIRESGHRQEIDTVGHLSDWSSMQGSSQAFLLYTQDMRSEVFVPLLATNQVVLSRCSLDRSMVPQFSAFATFRGQRQSIIKYRSIPVFCKTAICARSVEDNVARSEVMVSFATAEVSPLPLQHKSAIHQLALPNLTWGLPLCMRSSSSRLACWNLIKSVSMVLVTTRCLDGRRAALYKRSPQVLVQRPGASSSQAPWSHNHRTVYSLHGEVTCN